MRGQTYRSGIPAGLPDGTADRQQDRLDRRPHPRHGDRAARGRDAVRAGGADPAGRRTDRRGERPDRRGGPRGVGAAGDDHHRAARPRAAEPAAAHAVRDRAAPGHDRRDGRGAGDRQRRAGRPGRGAAGLAGHRRLGRRLGRLPGGAAAPGRARTVRRPGADVAGRSRGRWPATVRPRPPSTARCTTSPGLRTDAGADGRHGAGGRAGRDRRGGAGAGGGGVLGAQAQGRHRRRHRPGPGARRPRRRRSRRHGAPRRQPGLGLPSRPSR